MTQGQTANVQKCAKRVNEKFRLGYLIYCVYFLQKKSIDWNVEWIFFWSFGRVFARLSFEPLYRPFDPVPKSVNPPTPVQCTRDVNVLIFLDFSFRYDSVHEKY